MEIIKKISRGEKFQTLIIRLIRIYVILAGLFFLYDQNWIFLFLSFVSLFVSYIPTILRKLFKMYLPLEYDLVLTLFIFLSNFLGETHHFFKTYWWWDLAMHTFSGLWLAFLGFLLVYLFNKEHANKISPFFMALFAFTFTVTVAVIFEYLEYLWDVYLAFFYVMLDDGLLGTLSDLLADTIGGLVIAITGYIILKYKRNTFLLKKCFFDVIKKNPHLFKSRK